MINRSANVLAVEGPCVVGASEPGPEMQRRRIEIDTTSGVIVSVGDATGSGDLVLDDRHLVLPGVVDAHVHAREDATGRDCYKEDFASAGDAALHGGVTAFAEMPNNPRPPLDEGSYREKRELARGSCAVDVLIYAGIGPRTRPLPFPVPYKAYMGPSIGELYFEDDETLREALARYHGQRVAFHAESPTILRQSNAAPTHAERRPPEAERAAVATAIEFCEAFQIEPHICHLSTADGLEVIRHARRRGVTVTCEVTPHHLYFDQDNAQDFARPGFLQCNPPIRTRLDRIALLEAVRRREVDFLATDHAPHTFEENERGVSGIPQLDTVGPFLFWLHDQGISWRVLREICCERPGRFFNRYSATPRGRLEAGWLGNLTVLLAQPHVVRRAALRTRAAWSPFEGATFSGAVSHTVVRGRVFSQEVDG